MKNHLILQRYIPLTLLLLLLFVSSTSLVLADEDEVATKVEIVNISEGDTISELTVIQGTINFPDFLKYEIFLKAGDSLVWVGNAYHAVIDGNLVRLDPRVFVSGSYQLIIRQVNSDFNYTDVAGPIIKIDNPKDAPLPYYPEIEPSFLYPSNNFAIVRVRNCTGEDFNYDYTSPMDFRSAGDATLQGKPEGYAICPFHDLALIPGEYRGTGQGGGQTKGVPINFTVDEWHVYHLIYNGPGAGGDEVFFQEVPSDELAVDENGVAIPGGFAADPATEKAKASKAPKAKESGTREAMLPVTGNLADNQSFPVILTIGFVLLLAVGGVIAARKRQFTANK